MRYMLYLKNMKHTVPSNLKYFCSHINSLKRDSGFPKPMVFNRKCLSGPKGIAEAFATILNNPKRALQAYDF